MDTCLNAFQLSALHCQMSDRHTYSGMKKSEVDPGSHLFCFEVQDLGSVQSECFRVFSCFRVLCHTGRKIDWFLSSSPIAFIISRGIGVSAVIDLFIVGHFRN